MQITGEDIASQFRKDLDSIASDLISSYGLQFKQEVKNLSDPLLRWLDFKSRFVAPTPRKIFVSSQFPIKLPEPVELGLHRIEKAILAGEDINPFQSRGLIHFNDVSGQKKANRTDLL